MKFSFTTLLSFLVLFATPTLYSQESKGLEEWVKQLDNENMGQRRAALLSLSRLGDAIQPLVSDITPLLDDEDGGVRSLAVMALGKVPEKSDLLLKALADALGDEEWTARHNASLALGRSGTKGQAVAHRYLQARQLGFTHRLHAAQAVLLGEKDRYDDIRALIVQLSQAKEPVADDLLLAVGLIASNTDEFIALAPQLKQWMHHADKRVKMRAISALSHMGKVAESEVPALIRWAQEDESSSYRVAAVNALGNIRNPKEKIIPALMRACNDKKYRVYENTASVLASFGDDLVPYAIEFLKKQDQPGIKFVLDALLSVKIKNATLIDQVTQLLTHQDWQIQFRAAAALGAIGEPGKKTFQLLRVAAKSENEIVALHANQSLERLKVADSK